MAWKTSQPSRPETSYGSVQLLLDWCLEKTWNLSISATGRVLSGRRTRHVANCCRWRHVECVKRNERTGVITLILNVRWPWREIWLWYKQMELGSVLEREESLVSTQSNKMLSVIIPFPLAFLSSSSLHLSLSLSLYVAVALSLVLFLIDLVSIDRIKPSAQT